MKSIPFFTRFLSLVILLSAFSASAAPVFFKTVGVQDGLPDNSVNAVAEDCFGGIWLATWNGLARFDGREMTPYRHNPSDPSSLSDDIVRALLPTASGVYVGTDSGLDFFDYATGRFLHCVVRPHNSKSSFPLNLRVSRLLSNYGQVFAMTIDGNILRLENVDADEHRFVILSRPKGRRYADVARFSGGRLIALSSEGVSVLDNLGEKELSTTRLQLPFDTNLNIFCDTIRNKVYIGGGIGRKSMAFGVADSKGNLIADPSICLPDDLMACAACGEGKVAFATDGAGVWIGYPGGEMQKFTPDNSNIPGDVVYSLCLDRRGNLWCGTYRRGLAILSPELNSYSVLDKANGILSHQIVTGCCRIADRIYVGLDGGGMDIYDVVTGITRHHTSANSTLPGDNITGMAYDGRRIWMTVYSHGLVEYDPATASFATYPLPPDIEPDNKLWTLVVPDDDHIIVGGERLHSFDKHTGRFSKMVNGEDLQVTSLCCAGKHLWVTTRQSGLIQLDRASYRVMKRISPSMFTDDLAQMWVPIDCVYEDSEERVWVVLGNRGLFCIDPGKYDKAECIGEESGLLDTRIRSITEDPDGNLWMGTADGLYKYLRTKKRFVKIDDTRLPREYTANAASFSDGRIWLGTTAGLVALPYSTATTSAAALPTLFSSLNVFNNPGRTVSLYGSPAQSVELAPGENFFSLSFSVPEMVNPERIQMECLLEGFDKSWRNVSETRSASYTNVPPGKYSMKVRHAGEDGVWTDPVSLRLVINAPWYATGLALSLWAVLAVVAVVGGWFLWQRYRHNCNVALEAEREQAAQRQLNDAKLDFLAGISHELRTPCFLISAQIESLLDQPSDTIPVNSLRGIYRNSQKLNKLISSIIDFRKMESGNLNLLPRTMDVVKLLDDLAPDYEYLCHQKGLSFTYERPESPAVAMVDPDKIEFIVTNLITNAYKYTPKDGGGVILSLSLTQSDIIIRVSDTGIGIMKEMQEKIFHPFFRTERGSAANLGDGIGLSFVKQLVELHNGTIALQSEVNKGTTFTVTIPRRVEEEYAETSLPESPKPGPSKSSLKVAPPREIPVRTEYSIENPMAVHSILIVEDDAELRPILANTFGHDYKVTAVASGREALYCLRNGFYDIVITDLMLPGTDGHTVIRTIKESPGGAATRIIVLSSLNSDDDMLRAYQEGADMYITKPVSLRMLRYHVENINSEEDISTLLAAPAMRARRYTHDERQFLMRCRNVIDENLSDDNFTIEKLCEKLAMSHSSLYKKIKSLTGTTIVDFINEYKICKAVMLFQQGATNIMVVAEECGFRDLKTFRTAFKRKMNIAPKQYIETLAEASPKPTDPVATDAPSDAPRDSED